MCARYMEEDEESKPQYMFHFFTNEQSYGKHVTYFCKTKFTFNKYILKEWINE